MAIVPDPGDLIRLAEAAVENAQAQIAGAQALLDKGLWAQAHALSILGLEELGKAHLCVVAGQIPSEYRAEFEFWKIFSDHKSKLAFAGLMWAILRSDEIPDTVEGILDEVAAAVANDNGAKLHALYVGYENGIITKPSTIIEDAARGTFAKAHEILRWASAVYRHDILEALISTEEQATLRSKIDEMVVRVETDRNSIFPWMRQELHGWQEVVPQLLTVEASSPEIDN